MELAGAVTHVAYDIIWEFRVSPKLAQAFEAAYGADGNWRICSPARRVLWMCGC
jgi:hypothetical protein